MIEISDPDESVAFRAVHADGTAEENRPHGLLRLLTEESSSKSVREGLAVVCDAPLALARVHESRTHREDHDALGLAHRRVILRDESIGGRFGDGRR